jgi:peptidyl-prolyl cis-trans isomerase SurA
MMLRSFPIRVMLAASMAFAVMPIYSQSHSGSDVPGQQANPSQSPYPGSVVEEIVARVNDQVISTSDYQRAEQELEQEAAQQNWSPQQLEEQKKDLLRSLIDKQLLLSKGKELDITGENELIRRLDEIRKQNNLSSIEDLQKAAEAQGVSFEDFKQQIREGIITSDVIRDQVGRHIQITPSEVQAYYDQHKADFQRPEQVKLSEILIPTPNPDDASQVETAKQKADAIETKLQGGADFAELAKADSAGQTAAQGGDLGDFKPGQLAKVLEDDTFSLKPGQFTQPIRTKQGWVILKVTEHQDAGVAPLKDVEGQIEDQIGYAKMQPALRDYLTKLRQEAFIETRPGYVDSGAAPNELKMSYSAYVPPSPKKKQHVERTRYEVRGRGRARNEKIATASRPAVPANVPTLDKVNAKNQQASSKVYRQKPGKKEKIRFGQAPREALPPSSRNDDQGTQVAQNTAPAALESTAGDTAEPVKRDKRRYSDELRKTKAQKAAEKDNHQAAPAVGDQEIADRQEQESSLGLSGNTDTKKKKDNAAKEGPKRRYSDEEKKKDEQTQPAGQPVSGSSSAPATPQPAPAQTQQPQ